MKKHVPRTCSNVFLEFFFLNPFESLVKMKIIKDRRKLKNHKGINKFNLEKDQYIQGHLKV